MTKAFDIDHAACGAGITVNLDRNSTRTIIEDALKRAASLRYRSGYNPATGESDGAGLRFYGLPTAFYEKKIAEHKFSNETSSPVSIGLEENTFAIGHYFFPTDKAKQEEAKNLIKESAEAHGLCIAGWRNLDDPDATDTKAISEASLAKKPGLWEAILVNVQKETPNLEERSLKAAAHAINRIREKKLDITVV